MIDFHVTFWLLSSSSRKKKRTKKKKSDKGGCDGVVCISHTEGVSRRANNHQQTIRVLAGYMTHPNVACVLLLDLGEEYEAISSKDVIDEAETRVPSFQENLLVVAHRLGMGRGGEEGGSSRGGE